MKVDFKDFPVQKLPDSKKTKEWGEASVDGIIARRGGTINAEQEEMLLLYGLYNSEYNEKDIQYVTNPFKVEDGFPAKAQMFNVMRPKIDLLLGEESKRVTNIRVIETNDDVVTQLQEKKKQLLLQYAESVLGISQQENKTPPEEIEKYLRRSYKTIAENIANHSLNYLRRKLSLDNEFLHAYKDFLIAGKEILYVGAINNEPYVERINPVGCDHDNSPELKFIEDGEYFSRVLYLSPSALYDRFYDIIDEATFDKILEYIDGGSTGKIKPSEVASKSIIYKEKLSDVTSTTPSGEDLYNTVAVYHAVWKSYKKVGFLTTVDENTGEEKTTMVDSSYKADEGEDITWDWIEEVWEGYRVGDDIYFGIGPIDYQIRSSDNPASVKLPYYGVVYSNTNAKSKSLAAIMKPLQYMYIILWYRLELALARDKGKVINMDITQIPKGLGMDVNQWMHYLSALGVNFFNPYDEGWDIPGREGGKPSGFNQFSEVDLTMGKVISEYIGLMNKIEEMLGEISGVSRQRQGAIEQRELVGNVERAVIQSSHITEFLFWMHNQVKRNVYTALLEVAKNVWSDNGGKKIQYIMGDVERIFLEVNPDFQYSDFDVFITDSSKEELNINALKNLLQPAMQNGATLLDAASILTADNLTDIKSKLADIEKRREDAIKAQQEAEQKAKEQELALAQEEINQREQDSIRKAQTQLQVAMLGKKDQAMDEKEYAKFSKELDKQMKELELKKKQLDETIRKNKATEKIKQEELAIKKKQLNNKTTNNK